MKNEFNTITNSIVSSSTGWDEAGDYGDIQLYNAILAIDTKKFKKGDKISCVIFLLTKSICQLYQLVGEKDKTGFQQNEIVEEFKLKLSADFSEEA